MEILFEGVFLRAFWVALQFLKPGGGDIQGHLGRW